MLYHKRLKKDFLFRQKYFKFSRTPYPSFIPISQTTEIKVWKLKGLINNKILAPKIRIKNRELLQKLIKKNQIYQSKITNKCLLTGRSRGIIKELGISRIIFKKLADDGKLLSIKKK